VAWACVAEITGPDYASRMRQQLSSWAVPTALQNQMIAFMQTPLGIVSQILSSLVMLFIMMTLLSLLGGVVAAKVLGRK
jgi:hypothetical protein